MPSLGHRRGFLLSVQHLQARQSAEGVTESKVPQQQVSPSLSYTANTLRIVACMVKEWW